MDQTEQKKPSPIMKFFAWKHLPDHLQGISRDVSELAEKMDALPDGDRHLSRGAWFKSAAPDQSSDIRASTEPTNGV